MLMFSINYSIKRSLFLASIFAFLTLTLLSCGETSDTVVHQTTGNPEATANTSISETTAEPVPEIAKDEAYATALLSEMTLEEKVGQMFFARCPDVSASGDVELYHLGGYVLFGQDFKNKTFDEVKTNIQSYQAAADIPLLIGVDEEGGTVCRVSRYTEFRQSPFLSPREVYAAGGWDGIESDAQEKCSLLASLGINFNLAPVCDVARSSSDFIYERSFSQDAAQVSEFVSRTLTVMRKNNIGSALKHFPGYGDNADTHTGIAYDSRDRQTFDDIDFLPFEAGIASGADMVLVSHNIVECMDAAAPASLSAEVHRILREELGYNGVIITDDLAMEGITDFAGNTEAAVLAVLAGNDMLCCTDYKTAIPAVIEAAKDGRIDIANIDVAVMRILKMKYNLGIAR